MISSRNASNRLEHGLAYKRSKSRQLQTIIAHWYAVGWLVICFFNRSPFATPEWMLRILSMRCFFLVFFLSFSHFDKSVCGIRQFDLRVSIKFICFLLRLFRFVFFYLLFWLILAFFFCSVWKELEKYTILLRREAKKTAKFVHKYENQYKKWYVVFTRALERISLFCLFAFGTHTSDFEDHHGTILNDGKPLAFDTFVLNTPNQRFNK